MGIDLIRNIICMPFLLLWDIIWLNIRAVLYLCLALIVDLIILTGVCAVIYLIYH